MADISSITLPGGGTYDLKDKNAVPKYGMGKNLLDNGCLLNPVNQRGQNSYSGEVYGIDRWFGGLSTSAMTVNTDSISFSAGFWNQYLDLKKIQTGKTHTLSVLFKNGNFYTISGIIPAATSSQQTVMTMVLDSGNVSIIIPTNGRDYVRFAGENLNICAAKLELGTEQSLCHNEGTDENPVWVLNEIPDYEYELYRCITSTADPSDTYANKSLATEQQLGYPESGTTASRNYTAGEYICWNGLLCTADTAIASGATFYTSGGNKNLTECVGGGLNSLQTVTVLFNPISSWDSTNTNTTSTASMRRMGKLRLANFQIFVKRTASGWQTLGTIADGERPSVVIDLLATTNSDSPTVKYISIGRDGVISIRGITNGENYRFTVCYFTE